MQRRTGVMSGSVPSCGESVGLRIIFLAMNP